MSLILDALNRSRQDADAVPGLATQHAMAPVTPGRRHYLPWAALLVALVFIAWLVMGRPEEPVTDIAAPVAELSRNLSSAAASVTQQLKSRAEAERLNQSGTQDLAPVPTQSQSSPQVQAQSPPPAQPEVRYEVQMQASGVSITPTPAQDTQLSEVQGQAETGAAEAPAHPESPDSAVAQLYQKAPQASPAPGEASPALQVSAASAQRPSEVAAPVVNTRAEKPVDIEKMLVQARDEMENSSLSEHSVPFLSSLSQRTKDSVPTLLYQRHDYSESSSRSTVVLNGKALKVGGSPASGVKVDEILPDSVVLSHQGTRFRLRALNSWVNL